MSDIFSGEDEKLMDTQEASEDTTPPPNAILIQTSDPHKYYAMLYQSARTTRAYCLRHNIQYQSFVGIKRGKLSWHATYNRIDLFSELIARNYEGWIIYVDADAWIADMDFDLNTFLKRRANYSMIAADEQSEYFWAINIGVIMFNLGHPFTRRLIQKWEDYLSLFDISTQAQNWNVEVPDDQGMFHQTLSYANEEEQQSIFRVSKDFMNSPWASFIRQALRAEHPDFSRRLNFMARSIDNVLFLDASKHAVNRA